MNPSITVIGRNGSGKKDGLNNICSIETHEVAFGAELLLKHYGLDQKLGNFWQIPLKKERVVGLGIVVRLKLA